MGLHEAFTVPWWEWVTGHGGLAAAVGKGTAGRRRDLRATSWQGCSWGLSSSSSSFSAGP